MHFNPLIICANFKVYKIDFEGYSFLFTYKQKGVMSMNEYEKLQEKIAKEVEKEE